MQREVEAAPRAYAADGPASHELTLDVTLA